MQRLKGFLIILLVLTVIFTLTFSTTPALASAQINTKLNVNLVGTDEKSDEEIDEDADEEKDGIKGIDEDKEGEVEVEDEDENLVEEKGENKETGQDVKPNDEKEDKEDNDIEIDIEDGEVDINFEDEAEVQREIEKAHGLNQLIDQLEADLQKNPDDEKALLKLALAYKALKNYEEAIERVQEILEKDPTNQKALVILAQSYEAKGDIQAAIVNLEKILANNPEAKVKAYLAILKEKDGDLEEALEDMEDAIEEEPDNQELYNEVGKIYEKMNLDGIKLFIKGKKAELDVQPVIKDGSTLVPVRVIVENLGAEIQWNPETSTIIITKDEKSIELKIGSTEAKINGETAPIDVPATIVNGRTIVPLRFISETFGTTVNWNDQYQIINIFTSAQ